MSDKKRAVQFLPFNGLRGYDEMIREKRKIKDPKKELSERRAAFLDLMIRSMSRGDLIRCIFYKEDHYEEESGIASKVDEIKKEIVVNDKTIPFSDIWELHDWGRAK